MGVLKSHTDRRYRSTKDEGFLSRVTRKLSCISLSSSESERSFPTLGASAIHEKYSPSDTDASTKNEFDSHYDDLPPSVHTIPQTDAYNSDFLHSYPEYLQTSVIDSLRMSDFSRLAQSGETYLDYMGGALYPESLVRAHSEFLMRSIMGNTHSVSNSSQLSTILASEARAAVLEFFHAPPDYTVIFTANASAALKLVGESFPFHRGGSLVLGVDSHNSVNGIRRFASQSGAKVCYLCSGDRGGINVSDAEAVLLKNRPDSLGWSSSLLALTGLSNISNTKTPLAIAQSAKALGYHTLLDAAALAPTSHISLQETPVDAMVVSFYKMFGYPTGVGALVVKQSFLRELSRPWFAGGTVDVVQVPGSLVTMTHELQEQFEDGTINYLMLPAITQGLRFLSTYLPVLPLRLSCLLHYLTSHLAQIRHDTNDAPAVRILSQLPKHRVKNLGEQMDTGSTVSLVFLASDGTLIPNSFIEYAAAQRKISLRTGCVCNPGGASVLLGIEDDMHRLVPGVTLEDFERTVGRELGVVRISLGLVSSFADVWAALEFAAAIATKSEREILWADWELSRST